MSVPEALTDALTVVRQHAERVDTEGVFPAESIDALRSAGLFGLVLPADVGGLGAGPVEFVDVMCEVAAACGSTAMVYLMHTAAAVTIAAAPPAAHSGLLEDLASGKALGTLAFSERGSRSHFWAPVSAAMVEGDQVHIKADKSWVTSAGQADVYVVTAGSVTANAGEVDLYALPRDTPGLTVAGPWRGLGLRGNNSSPMTVDCSVPDGFRLGAAGGGFGTMMSTVLPWFNLGNAAVSLGLAQSATSAAIGHAGAARLEHLDQALSGLPTIRAQLARMAIAVEAQRSYLRHSAQSVAQPSDDTMLQVLGVKASVNDAALQITEAAMRVCGGAAFSKHLPIERAFRDARAGSVMAPTADALYDFYGKAICGLPVF
ncbi:MAG: acyl-CoA dehydrogenase family protein [Nakamurella sp.]